MVHVPWSLIACHPGGVVVTGIPEHEHRIAGSSRKKHQLNLVKTGEFTNCTWCYAKPFFDMVWGDKKDTCKVP